MHNKLPSDENLKLRGCSLLSVCNLCKSYEETTFDIFFEWSFAINIWTWFSDVINYILNLDGPKDIWKICDKD